VLVKVGGAGACHSDLHLLEMPAGQMPAQLPFTLGHENAGWIHEMGPGATGFTDRTLLKWPAVVNTTTRIMLTLDSHSTAGRMRPAAPGR
jgi:D-arabinose 1-dehydrogenase-like Zn-dependent alcohol dehydrogenase